MGLEQVVDDVRREAASKAEAIRAQARKEADAILAEARAKAKALESARVAEAQRDAEAALAQGRSRAEGETRKMVLAEEARLRNELRAIVVKAFQELPPKGREAHLRKLLDRARTVIPSGRVWGSTQDVTFLSTQKQYHYEGSLPIAGGIVVESEDGSTRFDLSYETLLDDMWRDVIRAEAGLFR